MEELSPEKQDAAFEALLREADAYMNETSELHLAAADLADRLSEMGIDYAVLGALALGFHGFKRLTTDVDVLIRREDLARFKTAWLGRGYLDVFPGSKAIRDTAHGIKIDFLLTGEYPGDGKPKPVAFPDPKDMRGAGERFDIASLPALIELKLASGISAPHRGQDLVDVQRLIHVRKLPRDFAEQLNPYVREKFGELWQLAQHPDEDY